MKYNVYLFLIIGITGCYEDIKFGKEQSFFKIFGQSQDDFIYEAIENPNGGYLAIGSTLSFDSNNIITTSNSNRANAIIISVDESGNQIGQKVFNINNKSTELKAVVPLSGNFAGVGTTLNGQFSDIWVSFFNAQLDILQTYTYESPNVNDIAIGLTSSSDNGLILLINRALSEQSSSILIMRINAEGTILWQREYGIRNAVSNLASHIFSLSSGDFGFTSFAIKNFNLTANQFESNLNLTIINSDGNIRNNFNIDSQALARQTSITIDNNGFINIVYTKIVDNTFKSQLIQLDERGTVNFKTTIYPNENNVLATGINTTEDGGLIVIALDIESNFIFSIEQTFDIRNLILNSKLVRLTKYDKQFNEDWKVNLGGERQSALTIFQNSREEYIIGGSLVLGTTFMGSLIKTNSQGLISN